LERLYFCFQFFFVLFSAINGWTPTNFFWRRCTSFFICQEHSSLLSFFALIFVQILFYLCIKVYLDHWSMLVFIKRVVSKRFECCWKREKVSCKKVVK
jgi:hypothetical protein